MKIRFALILWIIPALACAEQYGAPITLKNPVTLEVATQHLGASGAAIVLVESRVDKVCELRGCWIGLRSESGNIHVTFKDEAFVVPLSLKGKTVIAQGLLSRVPMTMEETRHHIEANGGDPSTAKLPGVRYELVASGLVVKP
jgi:hypothetical protein